MDKLKEIANQYNLALIEDAAEAIGSEYKGRWQFYWDIWSIFVPWNKDNNHWRRWYAGDK